MLRAQTSSVPLSLSVVIPAYNEQERIGSTLETILAFLSEQASGAEVLVIDDGSSDATGDLLRRFYLRDQRVRLLKNERNRGKGFSVRRGFSEARGRFLLFSDADLSTPIPEVRKLFRALEQGADVAIGSRALTDSQLEIRQAWYRETMGRLFNVAVRTLLLPGIRDTQCGFKLLRREAALDIVPRMTCDRFAFDVEMLYLARSLGYAVVEVPIIWRNSPPTRVALFRDSTSMAADLIRLWVTHRLGKRQRPAGCGPRAVS